MVNSMDLPIMIIDPSDKELFMLFKKSADSGMSEEHFPDLYDALQSKDRLLCFVHNHELNQVYVSFPEKIFFKKVFKTGIGFNEPNQ